MSQVAQLRLHALVGQKIKVMRKRDHDVLKENLSNRQWIQCISSMELGSGKFVFREAREHQLLCQCLIYFKQTLWTGHRKSAYPYVEQVGESVHVFYPVRILFPQLIKDG